MDREWRHKGNIDTVNSEKIALVKFLCFLRLASDAKLKFAMISAAALSV